MTPFPPSPPSPLPSFPRAAQLVRAARGFIVDVDGTLLDSTETHFQSWKAVTRAHGFDYSREEIVAHFGKPVFEITEALFQVTAPARVRAITAEKVTYFLDHVNTMDLFPGVHAFFRRLQARGTPACLASSNVNEIIGRVVDHFGLAPFIAGFVGMDDVSHGKPHPEMILRAADLMGVDPAACVVVGDSTHDIEAGHNAGCATVAVLTGPKTRAQLETRAPDLVLASIRDLLPLLASNADDPAPVT